ncbi:MAG: cyanophycinase [Fimbriimonadaceae bacterium]|nr:cyanophycinase [Fimbriimonadaceae bacterium]
MFIASLLFVFAPAIISSESVDLEHLSPYGLAKPVVIVAKTMPEGVEKSEEATVLIAENDTAPDGFQFLKSANDTPSPGLIGIYIPSEAALKIEKRAITNVGTGNVLLRLAKSSTRETRSLLLSGRTRADYNEWRRAAMQRTLSDPWPPKQPDLPNVPKGTLVIVGGGGMPQDIAKRFIDAGGGEDGHFVVLPISMPDPINVEREAAFLTRMGAKNVTVIPDREKDKLEDPKTIEVLKKATGVWFGGGRQWNFIDAYEGTKLPQLFKDVLNRGGVIAGSSAGATIQGDYLVRGAPAGPQIMMCEGYERGLGFLPGVAIDQHFSARNRFGDMTALMKTYPQFLGIGLDEATAIVVQGSTAEVMGRGKVHFYDTRKPRKEGEPDYDAYPAGTFYDLKARKPIAK